MGNFLKPLSTINLPKSSTFLGNFCKGVKIFHFISEIIFGQLLLTLQFFSGHTGWYFRLVAFDASVVFAMKPVFKLVNLFHHSVDLIDFSATHCLK